MTVRVRKPAVDIVEKISELDKPSGVAGEAMLRADTPQEQFNLIGAGRKNLIINGGFDVWQRGTSFSDDSFTADRWYINSGSATLTASRQAFTLGQTDVSDNPKYFLRMGIAGATTRQLIQKVEDVSQFSGKTVTLSYWAKSDVLVTPDVRLYAIYNGSGSEGIASDTNVLIDTAWKKYTHTFSLKSFAGKTIGASSCLQVDWTFFDDSTYVFDVANVQLELGKVATPFEHRSYGEELALCQRYYQFIGGSSYQALAQGLHYQAGTATMANMNFIKEMRAAPSISIRGDIIVTNRVSYDDPVTGLAGIASGKSSAFARFNTGITRLNDSPQLVAVANGADGGLELSAEL